MTTIAFRDGVVASDRYGCSGSAIICETTKIARNAKGDVAAMAGSLNKLAQAMDWFKQGESGPLPGQLAFGDIFLIFRAGGRIEHFSNDGKCEIELRKDAPYYAVGSGALVALGAMAMGANATEGVQKAAVFDVYTGSTIETANVGLQGGHP